MSKLKGPLFSLGAAGKLGGALVFFGWKGLNVVREYVIPSNPKTSGQTTQRGYLTAAVAKIHYTQGVGATALDEADTMAYALLGSTRPTPRTWFNEIVKQWLDQKVAGKTPGVWHNGTLTPGAASIILKITGAFEAGEPTNCMVYWGTSKTALINSQAGTFHQLQAGHTITGMVTKTKYFLQVRCLTVPGFIGCNSGIYYDKTT